MGLSLVLVVAAEGVRGMILGSARARMQSEMLIWVFPNCGADNTSGMQAWDGDMTSQ